MSGPKTSTLAVIGVASALCLAGSIAYLVHAISSLPDRPPESQASMPSQPVEPAFQKLIDEARARQLKGLPAPGAARDQLQVRRPIDALLSGRLWEQKLWATADFQEFIEAATPVADGGNHGAKFAIYLALAYCDDNRRSKEAVPKARCATLLAAEKNPRKAALPWLDRAATAGYPRALATRAMDRIVEGSKARLIKGERDQQFRDATADLVKALNSGDVAITWVAAHGVQMLHAGDSRADAATWVWRLASCEQGMSCERDAPWLRTMCQHARNCIEGETGREYIVRQAPELASLHARARELAATLRAGKLDVATFDATVTSLPKSRPRARESAKVEGP